MALSGRARKMTKRWRGGGEERGERERERSRKEHFKIDCSQYISHHSLTAPWETF